MSMTEDDKALIAEYLPLINAEYSRIGLTDDDMGYLGSGGPITRERFEAALAKLRAIPSGIGANAYFARCGIDFEALKREAEAHLRGE